MTQQEVIDGNKLIADFMGVKIGIDNYSWRPGCIEPLKEEHLNYHESWGWLMPVVEKIRTIEDWDVQIGLIGGDGNFCKIERHSIASPNFRGYCKDGKSFLEATYTAVIQFIQWYNQQK